MDNFIVSARKYRPATFASVVGQSHITSTLKNAISRGQLAHAYLFCGPRGVGKTTCARIFAKAINCLNPTADAEACNECESCKAFNENRSFNIHELDAASNNSVDDIRNLIDQVRIPPQVGRYSVYIIDEVHMLSLQAFNAFLKTLEEPPAHAVFILATTEKHKIIPTILSRCQIYDFNRIRVEDGVEYLKYIASQEGVTYDDESLHIIAQKADGGMRDALSMFDKVVSFCGSNLTIKEVAGTLNVLDYDTYFTITQQILAGNYTEALLLFDDVLRKGFSGQTFVAGLNNHFRDLLMCKNPQTLPLLEVTGSVAERYKTQAAECSVPLLFEGINLLTAIDSGLRTATNQRLHVELGLMKLCGLGQKNSDALTPLVARIGTEGYPRNATGGTDCRTRNIPGHDPNYNFATRYTRHGSCTADNNSYAVAANNNGGNSDIRCNSPGGSAACDSGNSRIVRSFHKSQYRNGTSGRHIAIGALDQLDPAGSRGRFRKHGRRGGRRRTDRDRRRYRNGSDCRMRTILARADAGTAAHGGIIPGCPGQRQLHQP
ncbi:MAG: DNA polymerase III subunit gamma/tau [Alistipes indistinctus]